MTPKSDRTRYDADDQVRYDRLVEDEARSMHREATLLDAATLRSPGVQLDVVLVEMESPMHQPGLGYQVEFRWVAYDAVRKEGRTSGIALIEWRKEDPDG